MRNLFLQDGMVIDEDTEQSFTKQFYELSKDFDFSKMKNLLRGFREYILDNGEEFLNSNNIVTYCTFFDNNTTLIDSTTFAYDSTNKLFYNSGVNYTSATSYGQSGGVVGFKRIEWDSDGSRNRKDEVRNPSYNSIYPFEFFKEPDDKIFSIDVQYEGRVNSSSSRNIVWRYYESDNDTVGSWTQIGTRTENPPYLNSSFLVRDSFNLSSPRDPAKYYYLQRFSYSSTGSDCQEVRARACFAVKTYDVKELITSDIILTSSRQHYIVLPLTNDYNTLKCYIDSTEIEPFKVIEGTPGTYKFKFELGGTEATIIPRLLGFLIITFGVDR